MASARATKSRSRTSHSAEGSRRRCCFVALRTRFVWSRRSLLALVGFVEIRRRSSTSAAASRSLIRRSARSRLRSCDRSSAATTRRTGPNRPRSFSRWRGPREGLVAIENTHSTRVLEVFACWPPGPPLPLKRHSNSSRGMTSERLTRSTRVGTLASSGAEGVGSLTARGPVRQMQ